MNPKSLVSVMTTFVAQIYILHTFLVKSRVSSENRALLSSAKLCRIMLMTMDELTIQDHFFEWFQMFHPGTTSQNFQTAEDGVLPQSCLE